MILIKNKIYDNLLDIGKVKNGRIRAYLRAFLKITRIVETLKEDLIPRIC